MTDLPPRLFTLRAIHLKGCPAHSPPRPLRNRHQLPEVAEQLGHWCGRRLLLDLSARFQIQLRLIQNPLSCQRRALSPGRVQLTRLSGAELMPRKRLRHPQAVIQTHSRDCCQVLRRHLCRDLPLAHQVLDAFGNEFHKPQPPRHPTDGAIKKPCQLIHTAPKAFFELGQQPPFFQRRLAVGEADRTLQHQSLGFAKRPDHCFHRVPAQLLQCRHSLVAVDDQITVGRGLIFVTLLRCRLSRVGATLFLRSGLSWDHDNGGLLPGCRKRRQKPTLPVRPECSQMFEATFELVELQSHRLPSLSPYYGPSCIWSCGSALASVPANLTQSTACAFNSSCAARSISVAITPMKSAPCTLNWSCARSHGSRPSGAGNRNGSGARSADPRACIRRAAK